MFVVFQIILNDKYAFEYDFVVVKLYNCEKIFGYFFQTLI